MQQARETAAHDAVEDVRQRGRPSPGRRAIWSEGKQRVLNFRFLGGRHPHQRDDAYTTREALRDPSHEREVLRSGEPPPPHCVGSISPGLEVGEQVRRVLNLVDNHRRRIGLQEEPGILQRQGAGGEVVQGYVGAFLLLLRSEMAQHRRLAYLSGARQQDDRKGGGETLHCALCQTGDVHEAPAQTRGCSRRS